MIYYIGGKQSEIGKFPLKYLTSTRCNLSTTFLTFIPWQEQAAKSFASIVGRVSETNIFTKKSK